MPITIRFSNDSSILNQLPEPEAGIQKKNHESFPNQKSVKILNEVGATTNPIRNQNHQHLQRRTIKYF